MAAVAASQGIESELIPKIASAFCSGLAETNGPCGALSGAVMGLSLADGRSSIQDGRAKLYAKTQKLVLTFRRKFGDTTCAELLQIQLGTPEASAEYRARNLHKQCEGYVREAARLTAVLVEES